MPYHYLETPDAKIEWNVYRYNVEIWVACLIKSIMHLILTINPPAVLTKAWRLVCRTRALHEPLHKRRTLSVGTPCVRGYVERACNLLFCYDAMLQAPKHVHEY